MLWTTLANNAKAEMLRLPVAVNHLCFSPDGLTLFAGNDQICAFNLTDRTATRLTIPAYATLRFGVSLGGDHLIVAENPRGTEQTRLTVWATDSLSQPVSEVISASYVRMPPIFLPDGDRFILLEDNRQQLRQWEFRRVHRSINTGTVLNRSDPLVDVPELAAMSTDGQMLACQTRQVIRIYPTDGPWRDVPTISNDNQKHFTGVTFHPNNKYLAATSNDATVKLYDTTTWDVVRTFTWDIGRMRSIAFSPEGTLAAAGSDKGKVIVWDVDL